MKSSKYIIGFLAIGGMAAVLLSPPKFQAKDQLSEEEEIAAFVPDDPFYHDAFEIRKAGERLGLSDNEVIKQRKKAMAAILHPHRFGDDLANSKDLEKLAKRQKASESIQVPLLPVSEQYSRAQMTPEEITALDSIVGEASSPAPGVSEIQPIVVEEKP